MQAMILTWPPQVLQVSMSMLNTRFSRCAQVIAARRSAGVGPSFVSTVLSLLPLPRLAGVSRARWALWGANTPWYRVRLTRGFGTKAASRAMTSSGLFTRILRIRMIRRVTRAPLCRPQRKVVSGTAALFEMQLPANLRPQAARVRGLRAIHQDGFAMPRIGVVPTRRWFRKIFTN